METELFKVRCYGKSELAHLYFPLLDKKMALKKLTRWIKKCTLLRRELETEDYQPLQKTYTAREVRLIVRHLGEP